MSPSPSLCLHLPLLLLLLLTSCASAPVPEKEPEAQPGATPANGTAGCVNCGGSKNETDVQVNKQPEDGLEELSLDQSPSINPTLNISVVSSAPLSRSSEGKQPQPAFSHTGCSYCAHHQHCCIPEAHHQHC
ncbi:hypothetical protein CgunFtcFv8_013631 [Champsocephalus gunnari]|uniref:Uncharacterized protein n=1 Tax=Champsocephalus gunnari TaxID=52237 RepID=A0AAN8DTQ7_CHAGU|nr:hypothetical protein CgunFtcFv8_013631 [Champsocephalus gunnari]